MTGEDMKAARDRLGMTQAELAHELGVSVAAIWRWEHDQRGISRVVELAIRYLQSKRKRQPAPGPAGEGGE